MCLASAADPWVPRMAKRPYRAALYADRCKHDAAVGHRGETAQCMRRAVVGEYCRQHAKMMQTGVAK